MDEELDSAGPSRSPRMNSGGLGLQLPTSQAQEMGSIPIARSKNLVVSVALSLLRTKMRSQVGPKSMPGNVAHCETMVGMRSLPPG